MLNYHPDDKEILKYQAPIEEIARGYELDFFPIIYEVVDYDQMSKLAAYGGFPNRYPHWRFGMEYDELSKGYRYGLQKIYEMVINTDPCYAYLMRSNELVDQKLVMAHVCAHCDFFKNNYWFAHTNRKMVDTMANHASKIREIMDKYGQDEVEEFIDVVNSLENLIDIHAHHIKRESNGDQSDHPNIQVQKMDAKGYMDSYINPPDFLEDRKEQLLKDRKKSKNFPTHPAKDILYFLMQNAPIPNWQAQIIGMIRDEMYYYAPQGQTKIMNEGWASYWHSKMMTHDIATPQEIIDYSIHNSGTIALHPGRLNPYRLGLFLFMDIEDRWNKGKFGSDYLDCDDLAEKTAWDKKLGLGREKIFEVRQMYNDLTFIDTFLTKEFCAEHKLFQFEYNKDYNWYEISSKEFQQIKNSLLRSLTNMGQPIIELENANHDNKNELLLVHRFDGVVLDKNYAYETLRNLYKIWTRPVNISTQYTNESNGKFEERILRFDGKKVHEI